MWLSALIFIVMCYTTKCMLEGVIGR